MPALDLEAFRAAPLNEEPFPYLVLPGFVRREAAGAINADYPEVLKPGSFPLSEVTYGRAFGSFIDELTGPEVREAFAEKFGIDLTGRPTMLTVRGRCGDRDGNIHTDSVTKLITVLIYMNPAWEEPGGRLRLLRSGENLDDVICEVPPEEGTLVAFRRTDNSWHGHKPFNGPRRVIQLNWVTRQSVLVFESTRHRVSAFFKRIVPKAS
jgi:hypothetical protein